MDSATPSRRGQSLVEFALVLPILLVMLLGLADFGRAFAAGIILEAIARNSAEAAAQEYLQVSRNAPSIDAADYQRLHQVALSEACREAERLPEEADADNNEVCEMPYVAVCIHDLPAAADDVSPPPGDALCGAEAAGAPAACHEMVNDPGDVTDDGDAWISTKKLGSESLPYVEVRACYRFTTLIDLTSLKLPFGAGLSIGEIWLQRDRTFTVADY